MGLEALYRHAPSFLQPLAVAGMGAYLRWQRLGGEFPALLAEAEAAAVAGTEELRVLRERRWAERIGSAVAAVAAYGRRPLSLADLERLPILTKAQVRQRPERFRRPGLPFWARVPTHTSGSTGAGLRFLVTRHVLRRSYAYAWRFRRWHGIGLDEPCAVFGGRSIVPADQAGPPWWRANPVGRTVLYSQYHLRPETVRRYLEDLRARRLRWIHGYPSVLGLLARLGLEAGLAGGAEVRWITVSSENLLEPQRRDIERMFGVRPRQLYGTTECVALACECA